MKHISIAMNNLNLDQEVNAEHISLLENILRETRNPKIAAVLALDLMLVGVDTVSSDICFKFFFFLTLIPLSINEIENFISCARKFYFPQETP